MRSFCEDESRFGLLPVQRRRMTVRGVKPVGVVPYQVENFSVSGAVEPTTGESFFLELPQLNAANLQIFLQEFAGPYQETLTMVLMDKGSCHTAQALMIPDHVVCRFMPPSSPELNPIERLGRDGKDQRAWVLAVQIEELEPRVEMIIRQYSKATRQSLTASAYFVQAVNALYS